MPQFAQIDTFASQIFWLLVAFTVLYIILSKMVLPRIAGVVSTREKKIDDDLSRAEELRTKAEAVQESYEAALAKAAEDARAVHRQAAEQVAAKAEKEHTALAEELSGDAKAADERIASAKDSALAELQAGTVEVVQAATERLIGVAVDEKSAADALKAAQGAN